MPGEIIGWLASHQPIMPVWADLCLLAVSVAALFVARQGRPDA